MSHAIITDAYRTRLGNLTAKCVLAFLADQANAEGYGYPSVPFIVRQLEMSERTVWRVIEVFVTVGLVTLVDDGVHKRRGIQINLDKLGTDLKADYAREFAAVHDARSTPPTVPGTPAATVPGTPPTVPGTPATVPGTEPPHPLNGVPAIVPLWSRVSPEAKLTPDPARYEFFKKAIARYWEIKNPGVVMPWGKSEKQNLASLLDIEPDKFLAFLVARLASEVNHGDRPGTWLRSIAKYNSGPIDRFGLPINPGGTNGTSRPSATHERVTNNLRAIDEAFARLGVA